MCDVLIQVKVIHITFAFRNIHAAIRLTTGTCAHLHMGTSHPTRIQKIP